MGALTSLSPRTKLHSLITKLTNYYSKCTQEFDKSEKNTPKIMGRMPKMNKF